MSIATICLADLEPELQAKVVGCACFDKKGAPISKIERVNLRGYVLLGGYDSYGQRIKKFENVYFMPVTVEKLKETK